MRAAVSITLGLPQSAKVAIEEEGRSLRRRASRRSLQPTEGEAMARREDGPGPARPIEAVPPSAADDPTWERLEDQLGWYDHKSRDNQRRYQWLKLLELAVAAALPVVAGVGSPVGVTGGLAAVIVVLEGVQHLFQFQEQWITYRSTAEALRGERYLYLARAGPYVGEDRQRQLAERIEGLVSQEHAKWTASHQQTTSRSEGR
jgi:hypothetical protein